MMFLPELPDNDSLQLATCNMQLSALPCDAWHHYYHYQSSAQYLWLAETLRALGKTKEARTAYERALFQDHLNEEAKRREETVHWTEKPEARMPRYNKHPFFDLEFRGLIGELPDDATRSHDEGATALLAGDTAKALLHLEKAIAAVPHHSNSYFARGKCRFFEHKFDEALVDFTEAIRLSHQRHDAYATSSFEIGGSAGEWRTWPRFDPRHSGGNQSCAW
jgi:tetratricopeptide (TPR) repeat protein